MQEFFASNTALVPRSKDDRGRTLATTLTLLLSWPFSGQSDNRMRFLDGRECERSISPLEEDRFELRGIFLKCKEDGDDEMDGKRK